MDNVHASVVSPVTGNLNCIKVGEIETNILADIYLSALGIDVQKYFTGIPYLEIFQCQDTGYRFYHPFHVSGNDDFYIQLQKYDWYYMDWKWEHQVVFDDIKKNQRVLEIGCGKASFIKRVTIEKQALTYGLELNPNAALSGLPDNCKIENRYIKSFAIDYPDFFDWVCTFQVLEHVSDVKSFLTDALKCLKPGGKLVLSVPNNRSFIRHSFWPILNMPPHHMGLWDESSLKNLTNFFNLTYERSFFEKLQPHHDVLFLTNQMLRYLPKTRFVAKTVNRVARWVPKFWLNLFRHKIIGHTILIVYTKK